MKQRRRQQRQHSDRQKRQADAAELVEPAADGRSDHEREAGARHHDAGDAPALVDAVAIRDQRESDHPGDGVGGALHQPRGEQPRQRGGEREQQRRRGERDQPADHRRLAADAIGHRAHRQRHGQQRHAERRKQEADHRRRRAEAPAQIGQHRHRDRVGDDIGEGRKGDERDRDASRMAKRHRYAAKITKTRQHETLISLMGRSREPERLTRAAHDRRHTMFLNATDRALGADIDDAMPVKVYQGHRHALRRAPDPHDADVEMACHLPGERVRENAGEPDRDGGTLLYVLQRRPRSSVAAPNACNVRGDRGACSGRSK